MFIKFKQLKLDVLITLLLGFFSIVCIAATHNGGPPEQNAGTTDTRSGSPEVFFPDYSEDATDAALALLHELGHADARQWRVVTLNPDLRPDLSDRKQSLARELKATLRGRLSFNLFPDAVYEVSNEKIEIAEENSLIWSGDTSGPLHGGWVWFAFLPDGTVVGNFWAGPRSFQLSPLQEFPGLSVIYEVDPASQSPLREPEELESGSDPDASADPEVPANEERTSALHEALAPPDTQATITTFRVDVLFVYTEAALRKMTTQSGNRLLYLNAAKGQLNKAFNDSLSGANSNVRLNFVNLDVSQQISYKESDRANLNGDQVINLRDDIEWVATNTALQKTRKDNNVDIVIMIVDRPPGADGAVGSIRDLAPLSRNSQANESSAYAVVTVDQALSGGHFAHEACHIFSCRHEPEVDRAYAATAPFNANHDHIGVKPDDVDLPEDRQFKVGTL